MQLPHLQPLLHDEQCINGGVASQLELQLPQTLHVFGPEPYKHLKTTKLNPNTPWMKCNKKTINIAFIVSYLPWIILDSWKSKTSANCFFRLVLLDSRSQYLTSHAVLNYRAYTQRVDWIIPYKSSSFSIRDAASRGTLRTPQALRPNTFNNCSEANLTKPGFGNGGHCFATTTRFFHSRCALARARLVTFWSFCLCIAIAFPKMQAFILAWSWCQGPPAAVEGLPGLAFFATKPCTFFKCLVNNHLAQYAIVQVPTMHLHFDPTCVHSLSFRAKLGGQRSASG